MAAGVLLEQTALGHALNDPECYQLFCQELDYRDFSAPNHRALAFCLTKMAEHGVELPDEDTFQLVLPAFPEEDQDYGGSEYIRLLKKGFQEKAQNYKLIVGQMKLQSVKARIGKKHLEKLLKAINNPTATAHHIRIALEEASECLDEVEVESNGFIHAEEMSDIYLRDLDKRIGGEFYTTGIGTLDEYLAEGFRPGAVTVISAYTGMAKSTLAIAMAQRIAAQGFGVGFFSMETQKEGVWDKLVSSLTQIPSMRLKKEAANLSADERRRINEALYDLSNTPLYINDRVSMTLASMRYQILTIKRSGKKIDVVFIDLFGKLEDVDSGENLPAKIQQKCKQLRALAQELGVHFVAIVQLGRQGFGRTRGGVIKRPLITDIKNANAYSEEADLVLLLHRNKYYMPDLTDDILEVHIAKQRAGEAGQVAYLELFPDRSTIMSTTKRPHDV